MKTPNSRKRFFSFREFRVFILRIPRSLFLLKPTRFRFWLWLISLVGLIVPRRLRADWRQEWVAELRYREMMIAEWDRLDWRGKLDLLKSSFGAFIDALLLQPRRLEDELFQDLHFGLRMLLRNPGFTLMATLTLALGIGANTAIFSVVNAVLLRPLPYPDSGQLVRLFESVDRSSIASDRMEVAPANFLDWRERSRSFSSAGIFSIVGLALSEAGEAERIKGALASSEFFSVLGVAPHAGRTFTDEDARSGGRFAVLSYNLWQRRFGGASDAIGRQIQIDGFNFTVTGVMPPGFHYPQRTDLWELYTLGPNQRLMREAHFLKVVARLKPGVAVAEAQAEMSGIAGRLAEEHPQTNRGWGVKVAPLLDEEVGSIQPALLLLFGAVGLVLLIACANVASLMLVRAAARQSELSIRMALGAGRGRIIRQLLTESMLLAVLGGAAGALLGSWGLSALLALAPADLPRLGEVGLDARVFGFTLLASLATGVLFGLAPAWQAVRQDIGGRLRDGTPRFPRGRRRLFGALVAAEIALALMVVIGGGLLAGSFLRLQQVEPGVDVEHLLTVSFEPPSARYNGQDWRAQRLNFWNQLSARVQALPGVEAVGAIDSLPFKDEGRVWRFRREGDEPNVSAGPAAIFQVVTRDYFRTAGVGLRRGRYFSAADSEKSPPVAIVNETMARRFWPDGNAMGQRIVIRNETTAREIVGVVADSKGFGLEKATAPEMYAPFEQFVIDVMPMAIRVKGDPAVLAAAVREQVKAVDSTVAIDVLLPMTELVSGTLAQRRFTVLLFGLFAAAALALAIVGIYGVTSYTVVQRTHEIGIRLALGAGRRDVLKLIISQGLRLAIAGAAIGLTGSVLLTRLMSKMLYGVSATDPATFAGVTAMLVLAALAACYLPARRATRIDPMVALRNG